MPRNQLARVVISFRSNVICNLIRLHGGPQFVRARTQPSHFVIACKLPAAFSSSQNLFGAEERPLPDLIRLYLTFHWNCSSLQRAGRLLQTVWIFEYLNIHRAAGCYRLNIQKLKHILIIFWNYLLVQRLLDRTGRHNGISCTESRSMRHYPVLLHNLSDFMWILFNPSGGLPVWLEVALHCDDYSAHTDWYIRSTLNLLLRPHSERNSVKARRIFIGYSVVYYPPHWIVRIHRRLFTENVCL